ncbi:unnamed protein product [Sordaria macrospora k-hell]|uniref:WGS project CABT00000000 data, contig 2.16 n=1 Tax=Sordaria macrospora (strain ATCC MYA-333 / DSM 997 / K(L3346) / K-hell) TaxID=771870 RepID=F7W037_SORMK|nr:unnamed protein product [Sordaria macrospora k-hell]
MPDEGQAES